MTKVIFIFLIFLNIHAGKFIEIDLTKQTLVAANGDKADIRSKISSGRYGHETPIGRYKVLSKEKMHISNLYPIKDKKAKIRGGAHMPYMLRVTNSGIAIHAGEVVNYPDSHGCVRLPYGKAMQLYKWADVGTEIKIVGKTPYGDEINQMRISLLKKDKRTNSQPDTMTYAIQKVTTSVRWVEDSLSYYDSL